MITHGFDLTSSGLTLWIDPVWNDGDGDGKFTAAHEYAIALVQRTAWDAEKLRAALADFDEAVAAQANAGR